MTGVAEGPGRWYRFTDRGDGDLAAGSVGVERRRQEVVPLPWTWLRQHHGAEVVVVEGPGDHAGDDADAAVTAVAGLALAVQIADCAPVALTGSTGSGDAAVGVVHAGWRGLIAGVVPAAVDAMRRLGVAEVRAVVGPCIHAECYPFGDADLDVVAEALGGGVRARASDGRPAMDLVAGVRAALAGAEVDACTEVGICTACSWRHWSHRGGDVERQALVASLHR